MEIWTTATCSFNKTDEFRKTVKAWDRALLDTGKKFIEVEILEEITIWYLFWKKKGFIIKFTYNHYWHVELNDLYPIDYFDDFIEIN